jgi:hypothetical protein
MELVLRAVPVCRGSQGEHQSYVGTLFFGDVARLLNDDRLYVPNEPDLPTSPNANPTLHESRRSLGIFWRPTKTARHFSRRFV